MEVKQVFGILNTIVKEHLGDSVIVNEDLSNIVDVGNTIENEMGLDNYAKALTNHIGKMVFVDRIYKGRVPSMLKTAWEYGSIAQKIWDELPELTENEKWGLVEGETVNQDVFNPAKVHQKFYNKAVTFEIDRSFTRDQLKESFSSAEQLNGFYSMIQNSIKNRLTLANDNLIMRTMNNMISETIYADYTGAEYATKSGGKAINLLYLYNHSKTPVGKLTAKQAITDPDFLRFAAYQIKLTAKHMTEYTTLYNMGGTSKFTPMDEMHIVMLEDFKTGADVYLQSSTFHDELTALPKAESVSFWQGPGKSFAFEDISKIDAKTTEGHTVNAGGILCTMYDNRAMAVANFKEEVETHWNGKGKFWNYFYSTEARYFNDFNENMVVFFVA